MSRNYQCRFLVTLALAYIVLGLLSRLTIFFSFPLEGLDSALQLAQAAAMGLINDAASFVYVGLIPAALILLPVWNKAARPGPTVKTAAFLFFALMLAFWIFVAVSEYFFWDEFGCRFNFIAVDYLIYTREVVDNIIESYNLPLILAGIFLISLAFSRLILAVVFRQNAHERSSPAEAKPGFFQRNRKLAYFSAMGNWLLVLALVYGAYQPPAFFANNISNELSYNGLYRLFSAYWHNQLDYRQFYPTMPEPEALNILRSELNSPDILWDGRPGSLNRRIGSHNEERRLNVIQIVVESLGSDLLGEDTPNLNKLIDESLYFANLRATGTRTVRGIEALTLSVPPTPGSSIVRRPKNDGLFNIGSPFQQRDYDTSFIYGGFGYFDNMNEFFAGNGWDIIDRHTMPKDDISFSNAWGVCDEDLFKAALKSADASYEKGRSFYQFVLTTSNHRPFTFPEGKVSRPSGQDRLAAVQYTDFAIGQFMAEARSKPWFEDSIFVIVADHSAGIAGKTVITPQRYLIPALIYSPEHVAPKRIDSLCSQIDLPPTILSILGMDYDSVFFGRDILRMAPESGRAYLGTYQLLSLMDSDGLTILAPNQKPAASSLKSEALTDEYKKIMTARAIAAYQTAQDFFTDGRMKKNTWPILPRLNRPAKSRPIWQAGIIKKGVKNSFQYAIISPCLIELAKYSDIMNRFIRRLIHLFIAGGENGVVDLCPSGGIICIFNSYFGQSRP